MKPEQKCQWISSGCLQAMWIVGRRLAVVMSDRKNWVLRNLNWFLSLCNDMLLVKRGFRYRCFRGGSKKQHLLLLRISCFVFFVNSDLRLCLSWPNYLWKESEKRHLSRLSHSSYLPILQTESEIELRKGNKGRRTRSLPSLKTWVKEIRQRIKYTKNG